MGPLKARIGLELSRVEPGRVLAFQSFSGPIRWDGEYRLAPADGGATVVSQKGRLAFSDAWRLIETLVGAEISRGEMSLGLLLASAVVLPPLAIAKYRVATRLASGALPADSILTGVAAVLAAISLASLVGAQALGL